MCKYNNKPKKKEKKKRNNVKDYKWHEVAQSLLQTQEQRNKERKSTFPDTTSSL